jgi:oxygen-independent coproporphyrinogen-3 oxidase
MCHNETTWDSTLDTQPVIQDGVFRLKELELDGLVVVKENGLMVPDIGKPFIRNICMALDARLWANVPETEVFSKTI